MERYRALTPGIDLLSRWKARVALLIAIVGFSAAAIWSSGFNVGRAVESVAPAALAPASREFLPPPKPISTPALPRLHLVSTTPGRNAREGTAQLGEDVTAAQTYGAGALLENGAVLTEIHADYVLIERDGQVSALYVDGRAQSANQKRAVPVNESVLLIARDAPPPVATQGPPTYTHLLRATPHYEQDLVVGFDLYPGGQRAHFTRLGLQAGDLLVSIDGAPVLDAGALSAALKIVGEGGAVIAGVRRGGAQVDLSWDGASLGDPPAVLGQVH